MTLELLPKAQKCNIRCSYCYQNPMRDAGFMLKEYDIDAMLEQVDQSFSLFGGEPLLVPISDLEKFFQHGLEHYDHNGIQTNGILITDRHIVLFKKYKVNIGISIDGPGVLNSPRCDIKLTSKTLVNIERLVDNGIIPSFIVTLHKANLKHKYVLINWFHHLNDIGVYSIRLHFLENDGVDDLVPDPIDVSDFITDLAEIPFTKLKFDILDSVKDLLKDPHDPKASCVWNGCDAFTTPAVQGVAGDGSKSNCGRVNKDGIDYRKATGDMAARERTWALWNIPQEFGGCQGCRFFLACTGHCPGGGIDGDWRNRSEHCEIIYALFETFETADSPVWIGLLRTP